MVRNKLPLLESCVKNYKEIHNEIIEVACQIEGDDDSLAVVEDDFMEFYNTYLEVEFSFSKCVNSFENSKMVSTTVQPTSNENKIVDGSGQINSGDDINSGTNSSSSATQNAEQSSEVKAETKVGEILSNLEVKSVNFNGSLQNETLSSHQMQNDVRSNVFGQHGYNSIKLPQITLPTFDGNFQNWLSFRDAFYELIVLNTTISNTQRFFYLNGVLSGSAKSTISNIEISSNGFDLAWEALKGKYDDKKAIMENHFHSFFNLKPMVKESRNEIVRLLDESQKHIRALEKLGEKLSDSVIVYIVKQRFDTETRKLWENEDASDTFPSWSKMVDFLNRRCRALVGTSDSGHKSSHVNHRHSNDRISKTFVSSTDNSNSSQRSSCVMCKETHFLSSCNKFLVQTPQQRFETLKRLNLCLKCLKGGHRVFQCRMPNCKKCNGRHNTLLHIEELSQSKCTTSTNSIENGATFVSLEPEMSNGVKSNLPLQNGSTSLFCKSPSQGQVVLPTVVLEILDSSGIYRECRALLDSASQSNFITNEMADKLSIPKRRMEFSIWGINKSSTKLTQKLTAKIKSRVSTFTNESEYLIVPQIANHLPNYSFNAEWKNHLPPNVQLADPSFNVANKIDMLLGVDIFYKIVENESFKLSNDMPTLHKTAFGWVVGGYVNSAQTFVCVNENKEEEELNELIQKFWLIDSLEPKPVMSVEERNCENLFEKTYRRDESGRFVVHLPLKEDGVEMLGDSKTQALKRFSYLENKFRKQPEVKEKYIAFMEEYERLGHMKPCEPNRSSEMVHEYFLPHHAVYKDSKIRVVFDASANSSTNVSLNDILLVGPVVQPDLFSIILNFRKFAYVFTTDIEKMYRQITVHKNHRPLQKILWRSSENEPIQEYELQTVTYGTSAAPYLATKCLVQLAIEEKDRYPLASAATLNHFYVDDLLAGSNDIEDALRLQRELIEMLKDAGMALRKWSSNTPQLLDVIPAEDHAQAANSNETIKTLGLIWNSSTDHFNFLISPVGYSSPSTKRQVLSSIAKLFDPLGLVAPVIVTAKVIMQQIWVSKIDWDEFLPTHLQSAWYKFYQQLPLVKNIQLERCIITPNAKIIEMHGFSDASTTAYGACIYLRSIDDNGKVLVKLVCSKSRVAPLNTTSIPRLELNAALLLSRLVKKVADSLNLSFNRIILWSDSSIVLSWLTMPPYQLKPYVASRVNEIQELTTQMSWRHVDTKNNAADILSRGSFPAELIEHIEWFNGPSFLLLSEDKWPKKFVATTKVPERKEATTNIFLAVQRKPYEDVLNIRRYSSFSKLIRVIAWCRRIFNFAVTKDKSTVKSGQLTVTELHQAKVCAMRIVQRDNFAKEITRLDSKAELDVKNPLVRLNPFIDVENLLRVGGRLSKSKMLSMDQKHQILLSDHHITRLLISEVHKINLHSGIQQTLSALRQNYWIVHGKVLVKRVTKSCLPCFKLNPKLLKQLMGELPETRIDSYRPFYCTGVDFCGPFTVRYRKMRKPSFDKVFVCVFVCFTTKAVHLEVVEDASSKAFIDCLKRFFSRRGKVSQIYSDNATNFVGAHNQLVHMEKMFRSEHETIKEFCVSQGITWNFIPPRSPHFGGIWESGVKVLKSHLKKIIGAEVPALERLQSLVTQIEGVMNSRPISELSSDPNDLSPLTPGHFLIGGPINAVPEPNITTLPVNRLTQWEKLTQMVQIFRKRFYFEYINTLQQRSKWKTSQPNLMENELVIVKEDNVPSFQWLTGRIEKVITGSDGKVRCAIVRTRQGSFKRPITKLAIIPKDENIAVGETQ